MSDVSLPLLRREVELARRVVELRRDNEIAFFTPHAKQHLFYAHGDFYTRYARTGNRFGKSEMGAAEDIAFALGYRPWYPEGDARRTLGIPDHPVKGLIITTDWDKSKEVFTEKEGVQKGKLIKYIPKSAYVEDTKNHSGAIDRIVIRHISGGLSVLHLDTVKSYKQNPMGQESSSWDFVHIDEPIPEGMWKAVARGLVDRGGKAWFTCTPLTEPWIDAKFVPNLEDDRAGATEVTDLENSRWMMTGSMSDNPHNRAADIARFMSELSADEKECRMHGLPTSFAGLVYKEFDWNKHVLNTPPPGWTDWSNPPADHCIYISVDYHFRKNNADLFIAVSPEGIAYVFAELWRQMLIEEEVAAIREVLNGRPYQPILMDPLASTPNKVTETTAMDEYRRLGLAVLPATKDPVNGIRSVKANLKARDKHGRAVLFFNPDCRRTMFEISRGFVWDGDQNKPVKENDDMMENLYRLHLQGLQYIEPTDVWDYTPAIVRDIPDNILSLPSDFSPFADEANTKKQRYASRYRS